MPKKSAAAKKRRAKIEAQRRAEAKKRNEEHAAANKEKLDKAKELRQAAADAAPKVAEVDLSKATLVFKLAGKNSGAIFIGRKANAYDADHLKELGITRVLNCAKEIEIPDFYAKKRIKWDKLECTDKSAFPIHEWFDQGVEFIRKSVEDEKLNVLVHCQEGRSRSTSMVVCYLIRYHSMTVNSALATIAARRSLVQPNEGFLAKLRDYEAKWNPDHQEEEEVAGADADAAADTAKEATADTAKEATAAADGDFGADEFES
jgi:protein-tyrosine phosphatase